MRTMMAVSFLCLVAGCNTPASSIDATAYGIIRVPNTAPRGSDEFCRTYAAQTTVNRIEMSRNGHGGGANGFDKVLAAREGDRAYARCKSGRTN